MKILHTADIHLKEYNDERWKTLQELIEIGKKEKIDIFVVSGDLFDKDIQAENLRPKIRGIFTNTGFKIVIIPGNHDADSYKSGMYFGEDAIIMTDLSSPFEYKNIRVWGIPFEPLETEKILIKLHLLKDRLTSDKENILLYHGELLDAFFSRTDFGDEGEGRYMPVKLSYFKDLNLSYVLSGHFHSRFDVWEIESGKYFIYPGSPISITKRETGQRKVNIFEVGKPPKEYLISSPYFENVDILFDPFKDKNPLEIVKERFDSLMPEARAILRIKGCINSEAIGMNEIELKEKIKDIVKDRCVEDYYEFQDVNNIIEDDLFKSFRQKLEKTDYSEEKKKEMYDAAIRTMIEARL